MNIAVFRKGAGEITGDLAFLWHRAAVAVQCDAGRVLDGHHLCSNELLKAEVTA